jgi:hypothetical protein
MMVRGFIKRFGRNRSLRSRLGRELIIGEDSIIGRELVMGRL